MKKTIIVTFLIIALTISTLTITTKTKQKPIQTPTNTTITPKQPDYQWVFMVYLDGDNNLESAAIDDFLEMSSVGSTDQVLILVLFDRWNGQGSADDNTSYGDWTDTRLFVIDQNEEPYPDNADEVWGERNMGDWQTLYDFIAYGLEHYTAYHYAVILWDHGAGYLGSAVDDDNIPGDDSYDLLADSELKLALKNIYQEYGVRLDILGFDMCLMGSIEVAYNLWNYVDIVVFSQEFEAEDGWPYDTILDYLVNNPSVDPATLASEIVDKYIESYDVLSGNYYPYATLSAVNLTKLRDAIPKLNRLVGYMLRNYDALESDILQAVDNAEIFGDTGDENSFNNTRDLIDFLDQLYSNTGDTALQDLITDAKNALSAAIINSGSLSEHPNANGISAVFKGYNLYYDYYGDLPYSRYQQWVSFVNKLGGLNAGIWFYDIGFAGDDFDSDGYLDTNITLTFDFDVDVSSINITVKVYTDNGVYLGSSGYHVISGASSSDEFSFEIHPTSEGIYNLKFGIYDDSGRLIKFYGVYADEDLVGIKMELDDFEPPTIKIISPSNGSIIENLTVVFQLNLSDDVGVGSLTVLINGSFVPDVSINKTYDGYPTAFTDTIAIEFDEYGFYIVTFVVYDYSGKSSSGNVAIKLVSPHAEEGTSGGESTLSNIGASLAGLSTEDLLALAILAIIVIAVIVIILKTRRS